MSQNQKVTMRRKSGDSPMRLGERREKLSARTGKLSTGRVIQLYSGGMVQAVTFAYLIY